MSQLRDTINATGAASPASRTNERPLNAPEQTGTHFDLHDLCQRLDMPEATHAFGAHPLYDTGVGGYQWMERNAAAVYTVKDAAHAHDRMEERTPLHRDNVEVLQQHADGRGVAPGHYYVPLRDRAGNVFGYAAFKTVPGRKDPVLATVLGRGMNPKGLDLIKAGGLFTTDRRAPRPDEALSRVGRETRVGDGKTGVAGIAQEFNAADTLRDTDTIDDFRGLGKISAWRRYGVAP